VDTNGFSFNRGMMRQAFFQNLRLSLHHPQLGGGDRQALMTRPQVVSRAISGDHSAIAIL